jgi:hypothetical protein
MAELAKTGRQSGAKTSRIHLALLIAFALVVLLLFAPRTRVAFGAPIYFIDVLAVLALLAQPRTQLYRWVPRLNFVSVAIVYFCAIVVSEFRGMLAYGTPMESVYMMARFLIAGSLVFMIPRLVINQSQIELLVKAAILGTLSAAVVSILYSLGPTRGLVVSTLFSNPYLNPGWESLLRAVAIFGAGESAMRGRSLVGAATMTTGFLATTWPLAFLGYRRFQSSLVWQRLALASAILAPVAMLLTYGRGAWVMVALAVVMLGIFGLASARRLMIMAVVGIAIALTQIDLDRDWFLTERIVKSSQSATDNPFADISVRERLFSYIEPFDYLAEHPEWVLFGGGRTGSRSATRHLVGEQLYDEGGLATHSAFGMAFYSFGLPGVVCQVALIVLGFLFIRRRMRWAKRVSREQALTWQSLFMCWVMMTLWWGSGHAIVGEARGMMLMFFMLGLIAAFEKMRMIEFGLVRFASATGMNQ